MNLRFTLLLFSAMLALGACHHPNETDERPPVNILPAATFERVLADFALAESAANMNIKNVPNQQLDTVYAFDPLADHGVRRSQYDSTLLYYSMHPEEYKKVYENVLALLSEMQTRRDSLAATPPAK